MKINVPKMATPIEETLEQNLKVILVSSVKLNFLLEKSCL